MRTIKTFFSPVLKASYWNYKEWKSCSWYTYVPEKCLVYVVTLGGSIAGESQDFVWRVVGSAAWMWRVTEQVGGKWRVIWVQWLCRGEDRWRAVDVDDLNWMMTWIEWLPEVKTWAAWKPNVKHWVQTNLLRKEVPLLGSHFSGWVPFLGLV